MTLTGVLGMGRNVAEARMTETWRIGTITETTEPDTYDVVQVLDAVYDGPARYKPEGTVPQVREAAGRLVTEQGPELHLPAGTSGVEIDMVAVCDACPDDASMVGMVVRIAGRPSRGQVTAARFKVTLTGEQLAEGS